MDDQARWQVRAAGSGQVAGDAPASLGIEIGAFARRGLDVELVALRGGPPRLVRALLDGELHFAVFPASSVALANAAGGDLVMLLSLVDRNLHAILAPPEITEPAQLRGRTAGVIAFGGQDDFCLRLALRRMDLVPDVDVRIEERGERSELWAALERREIAAFSVTPPLSVQAAERGFSILYDFAEEGGPYQLGSLVTSRRHLRDTPALVSGYVAGFVEACRAFRADPEAGMRHIEKMSSVRGGAVLRRTYDAFNGHIAPRPYVREEAVAASIESLELLALLEPGAVRAADLICDDVLAELEGTLLPLEP